MKRNPYVKIGEYDIELRNQPRKGIDISITEEDIRKYPDMDRAYTLFGNFTNIPHNSFILTNGTENALRIAMQVLKRVKNIKTVVTEKPTWGLADVISYQCYFDNSYNLDYIYRENKFYLDYTKLDDIIKSNGNTILYKTNQMNNLFSHSEDSDYVHDGLYTISDYTYTPFDIANKGLDENKIIIGSFSKVFGCGIRLGFVIFNPIYHDMMHMYREEYISPISCKAIEIIYHKYALLWLCENVYKDAPFKKYKSEKLFEKTFNDHIICSTPYYYTMDIDVGNVGFVSKKFEVEGKEFYRLGRFLKEHPDDYFIFRNIYTNIKRYYGIK